MTSIAAVALLAVMVVSALSAGLGLDATARTSSGTAEVTPFLPLPYGCSSSPTPRPNVTLSSYRGSGEQSVLISGSHFYTEGDVQLYWVTGPATSGSYVDIGEAALGSSGSFSQTFTIPPVGPAFSAGHYNVTAQDAVDNCGEANYTLTGGTSRVPQLTIEYPTSGIGGTTTTVDGSYFAADVAIDPVEMGGVEVSCEGGTPTTSDTGTFDCEFSVPDSLSAGDYSVTAYDATDGTVTSTNEFDDTGGQTTTAVSCAPTTFATSSSPSDVRETNCTATVTGNSPGGTVDFSTSSSTGTFFTWTIEYGSPEYTEVDDCDLGVSAACTLSYVDSAVGTPTITANYLGDSDNQASSGSTQVDVVADTTPVVDVSCSETMVTTTSQCTATVVGNDPTGTIDWSVGGDYAPWGSVSPTSCGLVDGSCSTTYTTAGFETGCDPTEGLQCARALQVVAAYLGDVLNLPASGAETLSTTYSWEEYDSYTTLVEASIPGEGCSDCVDEPNPVGGFGYEGSGLGASTSYTVSGSPPTLIGDGITIEGSSADGEGGGGATSENGGWAQGEIVIADQAAVTGQCDLPSNSDPSNLAPCLAVSLDLSGQVSGLCSASDGYCGYALAVVDSDFEVCDLEGGGECGEGFSVTEACSGVDCSSLSDDFSDCAQTYNPLCDAPCPYEYPVEPDYDDCAYEGGIALDLEPTAPIDLPEDQSVQSGDTLGVQETVFIGAESSDQSSAAVDVDPTLVIDNLDPASMTVSVYPATTVQEQNHTALELSSQIAPGTVSAGSTADDSTTVTNAGSSSLTGVTVIGSWDGALSCPSSTLAAGAHETCTGSFAPGVPGAATDYILANATNATGVVLYNTTTAPFSVIAVPFAVAVTESGLPAGTPWSLFIDGQIVTTDSATATVDLSYGVYDYRIVPAAGYLVSPSTGTIDVYNAPVSFAVYTGAGEQGVDAAPISTLLAWYGTSPALEALLPEADSNFTNFTELVEWAWSVVSGTTASPAYPTLAPYGYWYALMGLYWSRPDLQASYPNVLEDPAEFAILVNWAGEVLNNTFADSSAAALRPYGAWYELLWTYDGRTDLQYYFPDAFDNETNFTGLVDWAGWVVTDGFSDSAASTLAPFGAFYDLELVYDSRTDLQLAFPDAFGNETSYAALLDWAGQVGISAFSDSDSAMLAPFDYWYVLYEVYAHRADLQAVYPDVLTDPTSLAGLYAWADGVVTGSFTDSSYETLLPYASYYESLG